MDSVTQAALGAAIGGAILGKRLGRKAILMGALLGTLPDLDVMLDYGDAVANVTEHRGFSHSLFVLTGLATIMALLCHRFIPVRDISLSRWWCFFVLCLTTHPVLDSFTTYGTQLFWPLDTPPVAWPIVFIIDPLYTLPLLIALTIAIAAKKVPRACTIGLAVSSMYLLLAAGAKWSVEQRLAPVLADAGLQSAPLLTQATPFNIALWRATIIDGDRYFESLISVFDDQDTPTLEAIKRNVALEESVLASPLGQRLTWFTGPFLRYDTLLIDGQETLIATDIRLGFPGFHPFTFTLATWQGGSWQPSDISKQLDISQEPGLEILSRLAARAMGDSTSLCASDFIEAQWRAEPSLYRC
ncbi:metal-dependent hydrolase [Vreelandella venusta]|uniref:metal-dependent hydrolase n=1 Tax=Vreelandella venusta TaxID=44935 RepID=UPI002285D75A|nr:metal-dependent hydrolase [Halomonas venusta]WAM52587.1 metal-dependent hydrolase [Halomonas venusta]